MQALILVGGLGTRLKSVVNDRPKPMALVNNKPFLEYLLENLKANEVTKVIFALGYLGEIIEGYFRDGKELGLEIKYSYEQDQLGTAGAIKNAEKLIEDENFIVLNGDTYFDIDYKYLMNMHNEKAYNFTMILREVENPVRYGAVSIDSKNRITNFLEKGLETESKHINGGIYFINKSILRNIPEDKKYSLETDLLPMLLERNEALYGVKQEGYFIDIGIPQDYYKFINDVKIGVIK